MKMISITSVIDNDGVSLVYGLGDDNRVYLWDNISTGWALDGSE